MELAGRHAVITGAASGIGRACAIRFAQEGARVVVSDRDPARAAAVAAEIEAAAAGQGERPPANAIAAAHGEGPTVHAIAADVGREAEVRSLIARAQAAEGPIDLFFSNAGVPGPAGGPEAPDAELQATWEINVMAHLWAARALLPDWIERGEGYLLSTASAAGLLTQVGALGYSITKHAAVALAEWLSISYGDAGIRVSCLCPQAVRTPMLELALEDPVSAAPLLAGGVLEPDQVADSVVRGIRDECFLILPHETVGRYLALKGAEPERWLSGMRRLVAGARGGPSEG